MLNVKFGMSNETFEMLDGIFGLLSGKFEMLDGIFGLLGGRFAMLGGTFWMLNGWTIWKARQPLRGTDTGPTYSLFNRARVVKVIRETQLDD